MCTKSALQIAFSQRLSSVIGVVNHLLRTREAVRFTLVQDAQQDDSGVKSSGIRRRRLESLGWRQHANGELGTVESLDSEQQTEIFSRISCRPDWRSASDFAFRPCPCMQSTMRDVLFQRRRMA